MLFPSSTAPLPGSLRPRRPVVQFGSRAAGPPRVRCGRRGVKAWPTAEAYRRAPNAREAYSRPAVGQAPTHARQRWGRVDRPPQRRPRRRVYAEVSASRGRGGGICSTLRRLSTRGRRGPRHKAPGARPHTCHGRTPSPDPPVPARLPPRPATAASAAARQPARPGRAAFPRRHRVHRLLQGRQVRGALSLPLASCRGRPLPVSLSCSWFS